MRTFVITFASTGLRDGWVEVTAKDELIARAWASKEYVRWSGIYPIEEWDEPIHRMFPLGRMGETTLYYESWEHV